MNRLENVVLPSDSIAKLKRTMGVSSLALLASAGSLVCCVLPAVLVAFGAGAALAALVTAVPQLIWLSAHKALVFGVAATMLTLSGGAIWHARSLPCPIDPAQGRACTTLRTVSTYLWSAAAICTGTGAFFAFVLAKL